jgi:CRISPR-associated endonuclease Cas2
MAVHLVSYDLKKPGQNYRELIDALETMGERILLSAWIVESRMTAAPLRNWLLQFIDQNDDIIVITIMDGDYDWAAYARVNNPGAALLKQLRP